jgi:hypothetical protein
MGEGNQISDSFSYNTFLVQKLHFINEKLHADSSTYLLRVPVRLFKKGMIHTTGKIKLSQNHGCQKRVPNIGQCWFPILCNTKIR